MIKVDKTRFTYNQNEHGHKQEYVGTTNEERAASRGTRGRGNQNEHGHKQEYVGTTNEERAASRGTRGRGCVRQTFTSNE